MTVYAHRWLAFAVAGAAAGLAGGLFVFSKGSIDPTVLSIQTSVDLLVMVLLGGLQSVVGPLVGAAALHFVKDELMRLIDALAAGARPRHHRAGAGVADRPGRPVLSLARPPAAAIGQGTP